MTDHDIPRDRYGRPLIVPPEGGKAVPYTRTSTLGGCLDDQSGLTRWQCRNVALGLVKSPALYGAVATTQEQPRLLDVIVAEAQLLAGSKDKAEYGTLVHEWCEKVDESEAWQEHIPPDIYADVLAYLQVVEDHPPVLAEQFTVQDTLKVAGTPDSIREHKGQHRVYDIKTGNVKYGMTKIAVQLAVYAHSVLYDWTTETRTPYPVEVDLKKAIVIHLPAGKGTAELIEVDIERGWELAQLAKKVHESRSIKGLSKPFAA